MTIKFLFSKGHTEQGTQTAHNRGEDPYHLPSRQEADTQNLQRGAAVNTKEMKLPANK